MSHVSGIVFVIVIVFVYVIVFIYVIVIFVRPCPLITLIQCLKGHKSLGLPSEGVL